MMRMMTWGVGIVLASAWTTPGWAAENCESIYDTSFVGARCVISGDTRIYITQQGTFTDASGGTLSGWSRIAYA